ncbi:hypothetical protein [Leptodesmis sp.]|uniref:hypothetical protein n=1 Tax=Leptodesmis sp. TaxID=3100501 RepID=UPI0040534D02
MNKQRAQYIDKTSIQTLREGLEEYYTLNSHVMDPRALPTEFGKILLAHDVSHVVYGCDTSLYDELKILPLIWWTSDYTFGDHLKTIQNPTIDSTVRDMYKDFLEARGVLWLYVSIGFVLLQLLPELVFLRLKTCHRQRWVPFMEFESLLDRPLLEIRQDFDLLPLMK